MRVSLNIIIIVPYMMKSGSGAFIIVVEWNVSQFRNW